MLYEFYLCCHSHQIRSTEFGEKVLQPKNEGTPRLFQWLTKS